MNAFRIIGSTSRAWLPQNGHSKSANSTSATGPVPRTWVTMSAGTLPLTSSTGARTCRPAGANCRQITRPAATTTRTLTETSTIDFRRFMISLTKAIARCLNAKACPGKGWRIVSGESALYKLASAPLACAPMTIVHRSREERRHAEKTSRIRSHRLWRPSFR